MDGPLATWFFRNLLSHSPSKPFPRAARLSHPSSPTPVLTRRHASSYRNRKTPEGDGMWRNRSTFLPEDKRAEFDTYRMTTADELRNKKKRPKHTKMLMRDFIEDSLYNPSYGYFSKEAVIFNPGAPFDFRSMRNGADFYTHLGERYTAFEDELDAKEPNDVRQLWHTPTELFRPHYAEAMASYLVANYKISLFPYHDLNIYELGAGNGTFMREVLDYIRDTDPEVYDRTRYNIIEISPALATLQSKLLQSTAEARGHADKVKIINRSIFNWNTFEPSPCFVVALEVIDNFAHDVIRYNKQTEEPLQGIAMIDTQGEFYEFYTPDIDPVAARYFRVRDIACEFPYPHPLRSRGGKLTRAFRNRLPFTENLTEPEYIPTRLMQFFDVLQSFFPAHRLLLSDFNSLPNAVAGYNAPVVQTRYQRKTVPVSTPLVHQGYFDILFPTDFPVMEDIYRAITGKLTRVLSHGEFMRQWAWVDETRTRNGESPLLSWYQNASVLTTV